MLLAGCMTGAQKDAFPYATIAEACAPWDGPAIDLRLSSTPLKCGKGDVIELLVSFWRELPLHDGQTFTLDEKSKWGGAGYCKGGEQPCESATSGTIHIEKFQRGKGAEGTYELVFRKLGRVTGRFHAEWCPTRIMCG
jgi:hypothetical protein